MFFLLHAGISFIVLLSLRLLVHEVKKLGATFSLVRLPGPGALKKRLLVHEVKKMRCDIFPAPTARPRGAEKTAKKAGGGF
jgi:hypothetical protein